jgi:hypothetical protein
MEAPANPTQPPKKPYSDVDVRKGTTSQLGEKLEFCLSVRKGTTSVVPQDTPK